MVSSQDFMVFFLGKHCSPFLSSFLPPLFRANKPRVTSKRGEPRKRLVIITRSLICMIMYFNYFARRHSINFNVGGVSSLKNATKSVST